MSFLAHKQLNKTRRAKTRNTSKKSTPQHHITTPCNNTTAQFTTHKTTTAQLTSYPRLPPSPNHRIFRPVAKPLLAADGADANQPGLLRYPPAHPQHLDLLSQRYQQPASAPVSPEGSDNVVPRTFSFTDLTKRKPALQKGLLDHLLTSFPKRFHLVLDMAMTNRTLLPIDQDFARDHKRRLFSNVDLAGQFIPLMQHDRGLDRYSDIRPNELYRTNIRTPRNGRYEPSNEEMLSQQQVHSGGGDGGNSEVCDMYKDGYINASDVLPPQDLPGPRHSYISCQAPTPMTTGDMWTMVWQQHVEVITMLTPLTEFDPVSKMVKQKAHPYWPWGENNDEVHRSTSHRHQSRRHTTTTPLSSSPTAPNTGVYTEPHNFRNAADNLTLTMANNTLQVTYLNSLRDEVAATRLRQFNLRYLGDPTDVFGEKPENNRVVTMVHFEGWRDHGTPQHETFFQFMALYRKIRRSMSCPHSPLLVHCSAGVGRSGSLIAADMMLDHMEYVLTHHHLPDLRLLSVVVAGMRTCRPGMVQTSGQYAWLFQFLQYCYTHSRRGKVGLPPPTSEPLIPPNRDFG